jgi:hypothetical protein
MLFCCDVEAAAPEFFAVKVKEKSPDPCCLSRLVGEVTTMLGAGITLEYNCRVFNPFTSAAGPPDWHEYNSLKFPMTVELSGDQGVTVTANVAF